jgi:L-fuculose-phosphate aldolase
MVSKDVLEQFQKIGKLLFDEGLVGSHGGDMSMRLDDKIIITREGAMLSQLGEADLVDGSDSRASAEIIVHRELYNKTKAQAIVHAHPVNAVAVSLTDNKIVPQDATGLKEIKSAPIIRSHEAIASNDVARLIPSFLTNGNVIAVVKGHGSFAVASDLETAYRYTSVLENSCRVLIAIRATAPKPAPQPREHKPRFGTTTGIPPGIGVMDRARNRFPK